ncbi:hypothetical protein MP638_005696 [Amoeboaphelidium occidentale]|nr:hypothetical protein MP638_005696 [Amoeboaphelidium occidentale]
MSEPVRNKRLAFRVYRLLQWILEILYLLLIKYTRKPLISLKKSHFSAKIVPVYDAELKAQKDIQVLYHDSDFIILNKPYDMNFDSGAPVEGKTFVHFRTEADAKGYYAKSTKRPDMMSCVESHFDGYQLRNVHQLDYATSGVFCCGITKEAASETSYLFRKKLLKKTYLAIVRGHVATDDQIIIAPIGDHPTHPMKRQVNGNKAKHCETHCIVLKRGYFESMPCSLVKLHPITGRTHQLRIHMNHIGHPIIGDLHYEEPVTHAFRMMLHAYELELYFGKVKRGSTRFWNKNMIKKASDILVFMEFVLSRVLSVVRNIPVRTENLVIKSPDPFSKLISEEPNEQAFNEEVKAQRMDRHEWVQANIVYGTQQL